METDQSEITNDLSHDIQADEEFSEAWHSNAANDNFDVHSCLNPKVYLFPKLWCLRVLIIEAQNIMPGHIRSDVVRFPQFSAHVRLGDKCWRTNNAAPWATRRFSHPYWNEELCFVVVEPFENDLSVTIEDQVESGKDIVVARVLLPMATIEKQADEKTVNSKWFDVDSHSGDASDKNKPITKLVSRIHMRVSLYEGYNLVDEHGIDTHDVGPSDKRRLKKPQIGVLEMGILGATGLKPMKTSREADADAVNAYCVAKYGEKWFRTRTVISSLSPKWNEQYIWEVYDPCTVVTIGVFHNCKINEKTTARDASCDCQYGKIKIRLSTLETDRVYTRLSYPLLLLHPSGLEKMGELQLSVKFSCTNVANMLYKYTTPVQPKIHHVNPLSVDQVSWLRSDAMNAVALRLSRAEQPLGREVVEYMLDHDSSPLWSMRRSKLAFFRIMDTFSILFTMVKWLQAIYNWKKPMHSISFLIVFLILVMNHKFIMPAIFFYLAFAALWNYRYRPRSPPCFDIRLSYADRVLPDELDEEFDTFPTSSHNDIVRMRYDRLWSAIGRFQTEVEDIATVIERYEALVLWKDPRASCLASMFFLVASIVCYHLLTSRAAVALLGLYLLRPPWLRSKLPSRGLIFYQRLPTRMDSLSYESAEYESQKIEDLLINVLENFKQCIQLFV